MMNKKIFFGCPISQRAWIAPFYLRNFYNQTYPKHLIHVLWIVNNSTDDTFSILSKFKLDHEKEYGSIRIQIYNDSEVPEDTRQTTFDGKRVSNIREEVMYHRLAELRNRMLAEFLKTDCDYYFSVDSDILLRKDCLERLISHNKDFVSALIYNGYLMAGGKEEAYKYPNILNEDTPGHYKHIVNYRTKHPETNFEKPLIKTDFTGAVCLMSRKTCSVSRYSWHKQGEDEPLCRTAREAGIQIWCDVYNYNQHVMSKELLEKFKTFGVEDEQRN